MKPYSIDCREKVVKAYQEGRTSVREIAARFDVSTCVQKMLEQQAQAGHLKPGKQGGGTTG